MTDEECNDAQVAAVVGALDPDVNMNWTRKLLASQLLLKLKEPQVTIHLWLFFVFLLVFDFFLGIKKLPCTQYKSFEITLNKE